jgi:hypothetical protein
MLFGTVKAEGGGLMSNIGVEELLIWLLFALCIWPWWRVFSKAGYPGWYALSQVVPVLNLVALFYLAFAEWPSRRLKTHES